jgi:hypothetical protein
MTEDSDPDHIDPAGDVADLLESGAVDMQLSADQDPDELRDFIQHIENSDDPADPGTNAAVRMARAILEQTEGE